ncbi:hypothetical protein JVT61DRAFT_8901 [Boletus reticuloceps]|uniref:DUF6533 domain-containing protein n=1 Tax=Boletus reticuloceps TaxID=495285 RepID=A0A8I2YHA8_9AGAM|nr:hypothetical protein JVT61DRAFT_8901 [Boletus reticuloceps]
MSTASPSEIEQEVAQLVVDIGQNLTNNYIAMSSICFLVYDILINLDKEVEYIWKARWTASKALFIFGRYYGLGFISASFAVSTTIGLSAEVHENSGISLDDC